MLSKFITQHRDQILALTRQKVLVRMAPRPTETEVEHGVPLFLNQMIEVLKRHDPPGTLTDPTLGRTASNHGADRMRLGYTVDQLVHDYGDVCQAITELAIDLDTSIDADDFRTLNKCLDYAIAQSVAEFERQHERRLVERENERTGFLAHELHSVLTTAKLSFHVLKQGKVAIGGSTGMLLERSLNTLGDLVDRSLASLQAVPARDRVRVSELMEDLQVAATIEATNGGFVFEVTPLDGTLEIATDRLIITAAVTSLLRNAFKFSHPGGTIVLRALAVSKEALRIEVEDECGGLPPGSVEGLFQASVQKDADRSKVGVGLAISREHVRAAGGDIVVRNIPGKGCVFTVELGLVTPTLAPDAVSPSPSRVPNAN